MQGTSDHEEDKSDGALAESADSAKAERRMQHQTPQVGLGRLIEADAMLTISACLGAVVLFCLPWIAVSLDRTLGVSWLFWSGWLGSAITFTMIVASCFWCRIRYVRQAVREGSLRSTSVAKVSVGSTLVTVIPHGDSFWSRRPALMASNEWSRRLREGDAITVVVGRRLCPFPLTSLILEMLFYETGGLEDQESTHHEEKTPEPMLRYWAGLLVGIALVVIPGDGFVGSLLGKGIGGFLAVAAFFCILSDSR